MINCFEYENVKEHRLPLAWKKSLKNLEDFLQESWNQRSIFYDDGESYRGKQQFLDFDVRSGFKAQQYIGTIKFNGEQLNIFPKVFKLDEEDDDASSLSTDELMRNLLIWIDYCDKSMFPFISNKNDIIEAKNLKQLLITLYVKYLKETIEKQLFFQYNDVTENSSSVKGKINIKDYIQNKYPNGNKHILECTYSSFEFDNLLNRIIKNVCRILENDSESNSNKKEIRNILMRLSDVSDVNCSPFDCDRVHLDSMHKNYETILSMSKMFLFNKQCNSEFGLTDSFCFLFPADMLFEGFVAGFIKEQYKNIATVESQANDTHLAELYIDGEDYGSYANLREDILIKKDGNVFILDTKYKILERFDRIKKDRNRLNVAIGDIKQMAIYALKRNAKSLCLIYPLYKKDDIDNTDIVLKIKPDNDGREIPCFIKKIPFLFDKDINKTKLIIKNIFDDIL